MDYMLIFAASLNPSDFLNRLADGDLRAWVILVAVSASFIAYLVTRMKRSAQSERELDLQQEQLLGRVTVLSQSEKNGVGAKLYINSDALVLRSAAIDFPYRSEFFYGQEQDFDPRMIVLPTQRISQTADTFSALALGRSVKVLMDNNEAFTIKANKQIRDTICSLQPAANRPLEPTGVPPAPHP